RLQPTTKRQAIACAIPSLNSAKPALAAAPTMLATRKIRLAGKRSASPVTASTSVPVMKPIWTALVSQPIPAVPTPQSACNSSAALFALNQSEVHSSSATTMTTSGLMGDGSVELAPQAARSDAVVVPGDYPGRPVGREPPPKARGSRGCQRSRSTADRKACTPVLKATGSSRLTAWPVAGNIQSCADGIV